MITIGRTKYFSMEDIAEKFNIFEPTLERFMCNINPCPSGIYVDSAWHISEKEFERMHEELTKQVVLLNHKVEEAYNQVCGKYKPNVPTFEPAKYMALEGIANDLAISVPQLENYLNVVTKPYPHGYYLGGKWRLKMEEKERVTPIIFQEIQKATWANRIISQTY